MLNTEYTAKTSDMCSFASSRTSIMVSVGLDDYPWRRKADQDRSDAALRVASLIASHALLTPTPCASRHDGAATAKRLSMSETDLHPTERGPTSKEQRTHQPIEEILLRNRGQWARGIYPVRTPVTRTIMSLVCS